MCRKLGLVLAWATALGALAIGAPASAAPPDDETTTTAPVDDDPVDDTPVDDVPVDDVATTTTTTTTTTTVPEPEQLIGGPAGIPLTPAPPVRGTSVVLIPKPPPPTTTTTVPPPPSTDLPANSGTGRRAVYSKSMQRVWVVESNGAVVKNYLVSGKLTWCDPRPGEYRVFSRSRYTFAIQNPSIIWGYMVRFTKGCNGGNIGFHEIPTDKRTGRKVQSVSQLGTPLSGGCVRQAESDAIWMWNWAYVGTKVVVLP